MNVGGCETSISSIFNFKNAKAFAFCIMVCFSVYHGFLMFTKPDGNPCKSLFSYGSTGPAGEWRPLGCMMHIYDTDDTNACMDLFNSSEQKMRLYFIGDSRLFTLFNAFARNLGISDIDLGTPSNMSVAPLHLDTGRIVLCFFLHGEHSLNMLGLLHSWMDSIQIERMVVNMGWVVDNATLSRLKSVAKSKCLSRSPTHLVLSFGTQTMLRFNSSDVGLLFYQRNLEAVALSLSSMTGTHAIWMLQDPVAEILLSEAFKPITNQVIDMYNNVAQKAMKSVPAVVVWQSNRLIAQLMGFPAADRKCHSPEIRTSGFTEFDDHRRPFNEAVLVEPVSTCTEPPPLSDGFHVSSKAMYQNAQILLNFYCNNEMKFEDGTCCRSAEPITPIQKRCFVFIALCVLVSSFCFAYEAVAGLRDFHNRDSRQFEKNGQPRGGSSGVKASLSKAQSSTADGAAVTTLFEDIYELTSALSKFGLILIYFFLCDRTILFMKTNKEFTVMSFILPLAYFTVIGLFFSESTRKTYLNHVDITREWNGWMQIYFLIYHFTGAYRVVPVYIFGRFFVSAYLFLSGFGHFHYLWHQPIPFLFSCNVSLPLSRRELHATAHSSWDFLCRFVQVRSPFPYPLRLIDAASLV